MTDRFFSMLLLVLLSPLYLGVILMSFFAHGAPVFFSQDRLGKGKEKFTLYKFRTMRINRSGPQVTASSDSRITWFGRFLRRSKLDELPQLLNIARGQMKFVGPRPEVPEYLEEYEAVDPEYFEITPGITDLSTLAFRNEESLLALVEAPEHFYRKEIIPVKVNLAIRASHGNQNSVTTLLRTASVLFGLAKPPFSEEMEALKKRALTFGSEEYETV